MITTQNNLQYGRSTAGELQEKLRNKYEALSEIITGEFTYD